jgi:hypothetical protein
LGPGDVQHGERKKKAFHFPRHQQEINIRYVRKKKIEGKIDVIFAFDFSSSQPSRNR